MNHYNHADEKLDVLQILTHSRGGRVLHATTTQPLKNKVNRYLQEEIENLFMYLLTKMCMLLILILILYSVPMILQC